MGYCSGSRRTVLEKTIAHTMTVLTSRLAKLFSIFAFVLPPITVMAPKGTVPLLLVTATLAGLILWRAGRRPPLPDLRVTAVLALLVIWCAIASLWSFNTPSALTLAGRIAVLFAAGLFLFALAGTLDDRARVRIGRWLTYGLALALLLMVIEAAFDFPVLGLFKTTDIEKDPIFWLNRGATAMAMLVWPTSGYLWRNGLRRTTLGVPLLVAVILIFLSSVAAIASLALGGVILCLTLASRKVGRPLLIVLTLAAFVGTPIAAKQLHALGWHEAGWLDPSAQHRVEIWNYTTDLVLERPLHGWGFDGAREISRLHIVSPDTGRSTMPLHPHNMVLQVLLELGAVGGAIVFALLWLLVDGVSRVTNKASRSCAAALFTSTLTIASVSFGIWQNAWLALMISAALLVPLTTMRVREAESRRRDED